MTAPSSSPVQPSADALAEQVLDLAGRALPGSELEVTVDAGETALTRFANSLIHQNMTDNSLLVRLRAHHEGRTITLSTDLTSPDGLASVVARVATSVRLAPKDPGWPGLAPIAGLVGHGTVDEATRAATADERAARVRDFIEAGGGLETAGFCRTSYWSGAYRNSVGQALNSAATSADMDGIARVLASDSGASGARADGVARRSGSRLSDLDGRSLGERAAAKARAQRDPVELPPGRYEVVLESEAVADLLTNFSLYGFNGKTHAEGRCFAQLGEQQFDSSISLYDDPLDPAAPGMLFDHEGTPRNRLALVEKGVTGAVVHDRRSAAMTGATSTGHAVAGDAAWGPVPYNLGFAPGDATLAELIGRVERGILVSDLWYTRVLDPRTVALTGLTRNGVWLVEAGEIVTAVTNFRFTQSYPQALAQGQVLGIGDEAVPQPSRRSMSTWRAPALHLASWNFTGGASG